MKKVNLRMPGILLAAGMMIACFTVPVQGKGHDENRDSSRYHYRGSNYNGYSSSDRYYPRERYQQDRDYYNHKSQRRILTEIRKNEKRIRKLEGKIRSLYRRGYHRYRYDRRYDYRYRQRIRQLEWEIASLERRNRYLRRHLYR